MLNDNHWNQYAKTFSYRDMEHMLQEIYVKPKSTIEKCSEILDLSIYSTRRLIRRFIIDTTPKEKLSIPEKELKKNTLGQLAKKYSVSKSKIWRIKQALKKRAAPDGGS